MNTHKPTSLFRAMKTNTIYVLLACLCGLSLTSLAQSDSIRTEYKTEDQTISRSEIQRVIRYITRANVEEKTLFKVGFLPNSATINRNGIYNTIGFSTELSVERKIKPAFSFLVGFDNQLLANFYRQDAFALMSKSPTPLWLPDRSLSLTSSAKIALRYYYGMAKRIREGKSANNFSGAYVAIQVRRPVLQYLKTRQREFNTGVTRTQTETASLGTLSTPSLALQWGTQQRLGRRGYIDLQGGPELTFLDSYRASYSNNRRTDLSLRVSAFIGLGW